MTDATRALISKMTARFKEWCPTPDEPTVYHAVYSLQAALEYGSGIWLSVDGREVEVTCVDASRENLYSIYGWPDKVYVGQVTKRLRQGYPDSSPSWVHSVYLPEDEEQSP